MGLLTEGPYAQMYPTRRRFPVLQHPTKNDKYFDQQPQNTQGGASGAVFPATWSSELLGKQILFRTDLLTHN